MKHNIRQHVINGFGQKVVKIKQIHGELGSGIVDKNGKEIFEGDRVKNDKGEEFVIVHDSGAFEVTNSDKVISLDCYNGNIEVIGHVGD